MALRNRDDLEVGMADVLLIACFLVVAVLIAVKYCPEFSCVSAKEAGKLGRLLMAID